MVGSITNTQSSYNSSQILEQKLQDVKDKQGILGKAWNGLKEISGFGVKQSDCDSMLDKFNNGEISFEEAVAYIENFESRQEGGANLLANVVTGVGAIATATTAVAAGPIGWGLAIAKGAPIGAAIKAGIKTADRATNDVQGDALDAKEIAKDAISGGITGATSAVSSGVGAGVKAGKFGLSVLNGAKCSTICGAVSGASGYVLDAALEDDKDFNLKDLAINTASSAFISGTVGAAVGGGVYGIQSALGNVGKEAAKTTSQTIVSDSITSSTRKLLGDAEKNIFAA